MASVLIVIPYPFYPPAVGGALRCFYLLNALAEEHHVTVLTVQPLADFQVMTRPLFPANVTVVSLSEVSKMTSVLNSLFSEKVADTIHTNILRKTFRDKRNTFVLKAFPALKELSRKIKIDAVLYENLESLVWLRPFWQLKKGSPVHLLDAHNVDSSLWLEQAKVNSSLSAKLYAAGALSAEKKLAKITDFVFACSAGDLATLQKLNNERLPGVVVPNGVDLKQKPFDGSHSKGKIQNIIFCGTLNYFPNEEGLLWFYRSVFPFLKEKLPGIKLTVIGRLVDERPFESLIKDEAVNFIGSVTDLQPYYYNCSVAVVPLLSGSGTRLKILEAMSFGNPVVSTSKGAEGLVYEEGRHMLIADDPHLFAQQVHQLLSDQTLFDEVRREARTLVQNRYDWNTIGKQISKRIQSFLS